MMTGLWQRPKVILSEAKDLMAWQAAMRSFAALRTTGHEPRPRRRHGWQLHPAEPPRGLRPRHRAVGGPGAGGRRRRLFPGGQAAQLLSAPVCPWAPLG